MATCRERSNGTFEFVVRRKRLLPKPIYLTFTTKEAGEAYCKRLEALLDAGVVPDEFKYAQNQGQVTLATLVRSYASGHTPKPDDLAKLDALVLERGSMLLTSIDFRWTEEWLSELKRKKKLAPGTVRKYAGALGRCLDWGMNKGLCPDNPIRRLPRGYAQYTPDDIAITGVAREDESRDRRLLPSEEEAILAVLDKSADHKLLFQLALETAMRLRELYSISIDQIDIPRKTVFLDKTKNGDKRQVPLSSVAIALLKDKEGEGPLFPWWDGAQGSLKSTTSRLSKYFARVFADAGCPDLTFHDLRHEATSRLYERTQMTDIEIAKITGHKSAKVLMRYANLRGSALAEKLW